VRAENDTLKRQLADAQIQIQEQRALADRTRSLAQLLELRDGLDVKTTAAEIIGAGSTPDFRTVTIDKGSQQGLAIDMAVIAPAGVVGRVVMPSSRASKVQLLIDRNAAAGALVARSRAQGVVVGSGETRVRMDYVSTAADVVIGDTVVTSGTDGIYPKGLVIGRIDSIDKTRGAWQIGVVPAVDFSSLEQVLVVLSPRSSTSDTPAQDVKP
jgi:rod shape-determining protein MreC